MINSPRLLLLTGFIFFAGCTVSPPASSDRNSLNAPIRNGNTNIAQPVVLDRVDNTNRNVSINLNSSAVLENKTTCSDLNPPRLGEDKGGNSVLNYCGRMTGYHAYEFKREKFILFIESTWNEGAEQHSYVAKRIATVAPYEEIVLAKDIELYSFYQPVLLQNNLYVWKTEADGPGSLTKLFAFRPTDMAYLYFNSACNGYVCDKKVTLLSSLQPTGFQAVRFNDAIMGECEDCELTEKDVEIRVNEKEYTKAEVQQGLAKEVIGLFSCDASTRYSSEGEVDAQSHLSELFADFPNRFPCWTYPTYDARKVSGYFDLTKNEYVPK